MARTILTPEQIEDEYKAIKRLGPFENLLLVTGETPAKAGVPYLAKALDLSLIHIYLLQLSPKRDPRCKALHRAGFHAILLNNSS